MIPYHRPFHIQQNLLSPPQTFTQIHSILLHSPPIENARKLNTLFRSVHVIPGLQPRGYNAILTSTSPLQMIRHFSTAMHLPCPSSIALKAPHDIVHPELQPVKNQNEPLLLVLAMLTRQADDETRCGTISVLQVALKARPRMSLSKSHKQGAKGRKPLSRIYPTSYVGLTT